MMVIGAPHTSNWDWVLVILAAYALGAHISWLAKDSLFRSPLGGLFRYLGGIPVDRSAAHGMVGESIEKFKQREKMMLCITPEGTRSKVRAWKKGFHHIATGANVPIVLASFDYGRKVVGFGPTLIASGDVDADLQTIQDLYATVQAKQPQNF
jgi:1-acyl-sn-glycerol-3-phosphate acyltransferase